MPRRKPLPPDTRPDWRDPNMPVLVSTKRGMESWHPDRLKHAMKMRLHLSREPHFTADPTYNLRKDRK